MWCGFIAIAEAYLKLIIEADYDRNWDGVEYQTCERLEVEFDRQSNYVFVKFRESGVVWEGRIAIAIEDWQALVAALGS